MTKHITALAFDYGLNNMGIAFGQSLTGSAKPLSILKAKDGIPNWDEIKKLIQEWKPSVIVIGLPLNMDGTESELSQRARKFGNRIDGRFSSEFNFTVEWMDERLSSFAVKEETKAQGHKGDYTKDPIDALAAQMILEDWFRNRG